MATESPKRHSSAAGTVTELPSYLWPTTRECFQSRDKYSGHTIRSAKAQNKICYGSMFYRTGIIADGSFTLRE